MVLGHDVDGDCGVPNTSRRERKFFSPLCRQKQSHCHHKIIGQKCIGTCIGLNPNYETSCVYHGWLLWCWRDFPRNLHWFSWRWRRVRHHPITQAFTHYLYEIKRHLQGKQYELNGKRASKYVYLMIKKPENTYKKRYIYKKRENLTRGTI